MIWQDLLLLFLLCIIALISFMQAYKGYVTKVPPFQKGLKGTALATSYRLCLIQVACSLVLGVTAVGMILFFLKQKTGLI